MLTETSDTETVCAIIASEIRNASMSFSPPTAGGLSICLKAGDFCYIDPAEPRLAIWCHPLSLTEAAVMHAWGNSANWKALIQQLIDKLLAKNYVTFRWGDAGTPLSNFAKTLLTPTVNPDRTVSVALALAKTRAA